MVGPALNSPRQAQLVVLVRAGLSWVAPSVRGAFWKNLSLPLGLGCPPGGYTHIFSGKGFPQSCCLGAF